MKMLPKSFALVLLFMPAAVCAGPFDGIYKQTANADCGLLGVDGGSIKIEEGLFYGVEVECRMTNPVDISEMDATIYTMQCSGEGSTWSERAILMPDAEKTGIYMIWDGYAFRYSSCTLPE